MDGKIILLLFSIILCGATSAADRNSVYRIMTPTAGDSQNSIQIPNLNDLWFGYITTPRATVISIAPQYAPPYYEPQSFPENMYVPLQSTISSSPAATLPAIFGTQFTSSSSIMALPSPTAAQPNSAHTIASIIPLSSSEVYHTVPVTGPTTNIGSVITEIPLITRSASDSSSLSIDMTTETIKSPSTMTSRFLIDSNLATVCSSSNCGPASSEVVQSISGHSTSSALLLPTPITGDGSDSSQVIIFPEDKQVYDGLRGLSDSLPSIVINVVNSSFTGPIFGFKLPSEIKIFLNISGNPTATGESSEEDPQVESIYPDGEKVDIDIISDPNWGIDFGYIPTTTTRATIIPVAPSPSVTVNSIHQKKCIEYHNIGKRSIRRTKVQALIVGGRDSREREFPHMAALGYGGKDQNKFLCGGSLISESFVLTAAHCLYSKNIGNIQYVRLGTTTLQTETLNSEDYNVVQSIAHPGYIPGKQYNDIALLKLERPVEFSEYIAPICLYASDSEEELRFSKLTAAGWGKLETGGDVSPNLQKVELDYFSNAYCQQSYSAVSKQDLSDGIRQDSQICAGSASDSKDTCQGDSGGPLQIDKDGRMYLVGITSFGIGCGTPGSPGVYTKVSHYIPWIETNVWSI